MARQYKKNRAARRTPYETYSYWYDAKTKTVKGKKKYYDKLTLEEFEKAYRQARDLGWRNPAKTIAEKQRKISYQFQRNYEKVMDVKINENDFDTKEARENLFINFANAHIDSNLDTVREEFEALY